MDFYIHTANQISSNHLPCPYRAPKKGPFPVSSQTSFFPKIRILNPLAITLPRFKVIAKAQEMRRLRCVRPIIAASHRAIKR